MAQTILLPKLGQTVEEAPLVQMLLIGEIGLSGELRAVSQMPARLREAVTPRTRAVIPVHLFGHGGRSVRYGR